MLKFQSRKYFYQSVQVFPIWVSKWTDIRTIISSITDGVNKIVIHTLRHTFASRLAINGTPIFTIQKLMNHSDIKMTARYAKLAPDSGLSAIKGLYL